MPSAIDILEGVAVASNDPAMSEQLSKEVTKFADDVRQGKATPDIEADDDSPPPDRPDRTRSSAVHQAIQRLDYMGMWLVAAWAPTAAAGALAARRGQLWTSISVRYCLAAAIATTAAYAYARRRATDGDMLEDWEELLVLLLLVVGPVVAIAQAVRVLYNTKKPPPDHHDGDDLDDPDDDSTASN